ncbi:MAG: methylated-DNA--[protein]-cysteine S-methyltransferase [Clostridiales bacterium]|nr:methylated-DNA--[protein]-cysteine S-methyltransferase [Clostridiales bacterium]
MTEQSHILYEKTMSTPIGPLTIAADRFGICRVAFGAQSPTSGHGAEPLPFRTEEQLAAYFAGALRAFSLPLSLTGSPFSLRVWQACLEIPYGQTLTYGELALRIGAPGAARAVGGALNRNPVPILIPCHRVVGAGGALTGYAGGVGVKERLLGLERSAPEGV